MRLPGFLRPWTLDRPADIELRDSGLVPPIGDQSGAGKGPSTYDDPTIPSSQMRRGDNPFDTRGAVGTVFFGGILKDLQEYNPAIADEAWPDVADQMFRSSSAIRAATACILLPLLRATWSLNPASDDPLDIEIAQRCSDNLFSGMSITWRSLVSQWLLSLLRYGHFVGEKCWVKGNDGVMLDRISPRLVRTLYRWFVNPKTDQLDRIQQRVWVPDDTGVTGTWRFPVIPAAKLLLSTYQQEGNFFKGTSLYRHCYEDWYYLRQEKAINGIGIERNGMGYPWFDEPPGAQESDRAYARRVLASIHAHEMMYGTSPAGWKFSFQTTSGGKDALPSMEFHTRQIFLTALATFAVDTGGSYAKSTDLSTFFTESEYALAYDLAETLDRFVVREWVDFNYEGVNRYPKTMVKGIDRRQVGTWLRGMGQLFQSGALQRDDGLENVIRDWFDFPDLPVNPFRPPENQSTPDQDSQGAAATAQTQAEHQQQMPTGESNAPAQPAAKAAQPAPPPAPAHAAPPAAGP